MRSSESNRVRASHNRRPGLQLNKVSSTKVKSTSKRVRPNTKKSTMTSSKAKANTKTSAKAKTRTMDEKLADIALVRQLSGWTLLSLTIISLISLFSSIVSTDGHNILGPYLGVFWSEYLKIFAGRFPVVFMMVSLFILSLSLLTWNFEAKKIRFKYAVVSGLIFLEIATLFSLRIPPETRLFSLIYENNGGTIGVFITKVLIEQIFGTERIVPYVLVSISLFMTLALGVPGFMEYIKISLKEIVNYVKAIQLNISSWWAEGKVVRSTMEYEPKAPELPFKPRKNGPIPIDLDRLNSSKKNSFKNDSSFEAIQTIETPISERSFHGENTFSTKSEDSENNHLNAMMEEKSAGDISLMNTRELRVYRDGLAENQRIKDLNRWEDDRGKINFDGIIAKKTQSQKKSENTSDISKSISENHSESKNFNSNTPQDNRPQYMNPATGELSEINTVSNQNNNQNNNVPQDENSNSLNSGLNDFDSNQYNPNQNSNQSSLNQSNQSEQNQSQKKPSTRSIKSGGGRYANHANHLSDTGQVEQGQYTNNDLNNENNFNSETASTTGNVNFVNPNGDYPEFQDPNSNGAQNINNHSQSTAAKRPVVRAPIPEPVYDDYVIPHLDEIFAPTPEQTIDFSTEELEELSIRLENQLSNFKVKGKVVGICTGPVITRFEVELAPGVKVSKISGLADDLALALKATSLRILAPIPGKAAVGIEVPNLKPHIVYCREILESEEFEDPKEDELSIVLGKDIAGEAYAMNLAKAPHLLIAGQTGSGKSVCINTLMASILCSKTPDDLRMILVDPKVVELKIYENIPHLMHPVVTDPETAIQALKWACWEMDRRYDVLAKARVRNLAGFNAKIKAKSLDDVLEPDENKKMPFLMIVIDELADLMMVAGKEVEVSIARIAQKARAVGIHLVLATQRPSTNVITGVIKANLPTRISFKVASHIDARTIMDKAGAEKLLGRGDMLFRPIEKPEPDRVHGAFLTDDEAESLADACSNQNVNYPQLQDFEFGEGGVDGDDLDDGPVFRDDLFATAAELIVHNGNGSVSMLQRRLSVGHARAGRIMDQLESAGVVGPSKGSKARKIMMTEDELMSFLSGDVEFIA